MIRRLQGRLEELIEPLQQVIGQDVDHRDTLIHTLLALLAETGRLDEARAIWDGMTDADFDPTNLGPVLVLTLRHLSVACARLGDARRAGILYDLMLPYAGRTIRVGFAEGCLGPVDRVLGVLAATREQWDVADRHFEASLEMARRMHAVPFVLETQCDLAEMLLRRKRSGDRERARRLLGEVARSARQLGLSGISQRVGAVRLS
jgi:pentatricopeptide repeat protein